jgi:hypothetical protein
MYRYIDCIHGIGIGSSCLLLRCRWLPGASHGWRRRAAEMAAAGSAWLHRSVARPRSAAAPLALAAAIRDAAAAAPAATATLALAYAS